MKRNKGQALVEFVLILPVFLLLLLAIIDFEKIISIKNSLENKSNDALTYLKEDKSYEEVKELLNRNNANEIDISLNYGNDNYLTIELSQKVEIFTPGLSSILGTPYQVKVERITPYEK